MQQKQDVSWSGQQDLNLHQVLDSFQGDSDKKAYDQGADRVTAGGDSDNRPPRNRGKHALSSAMVAGLEFARAHGGKLIRQPGGFWTYDGCPWLSTREPAKYVGATTVMALVRRDLLKYTVWAEGKGRRFPIGVEVAS